MKLTKKEYASREEKRKDFWIGAGIFIGLNVLVSILLTLLMMAPMVLPLSFEDRNSILFVLSCLFYPLQILANIGAILYFAFTRAWIAVGMLGMFAFLTLLSVVAGVIFSIYCLATINN